MKNSALSIFTAVICIALASVAQAQETVKVGFIGPLTGGSSSIGIGGRNSADLAVRVHNSHGEDKYHFEMVVADDQCKPSVGVRVATKMAANPEVIGAITHYCSAVAIATVDVYHRFGLPAIVWGAVLPAITYGNNYKEVFRVDGTMIAQERVAAKFMTGLSDDYQTWVIIHDTTDYGKGHAKYFSKDLKKNGGKILASFGVTPDQQNFTAILAETKSLNPDVVFFGGLSALGARLRRQMARIGLDARFEGTSGIVSAAYIDGVGADLAEGSIGFTGAGPIENLPGGEVFLKRYEAAGYSEPPDAYGAYAYAAMDLLLDTIEKAGPDREKVIKELIKVKSHDSIVGPITFDDHGQNINPAIVPYVVQDGKWIPWEDSKYGE